MSSKNDYLKSVDIFQGLPPDVLAQIDRVKVERKYAKNQVAVREGDTASHVWFVRSGRLRGVRRLSNGSELTLSAAGPNITIAACCCFSEGKYHATAVAETDSVVVGVSAEDLKRIMWSHSQLAFNILRNLSSRLHIARRTQTADHERMEQRILYILQALKNEFGNVIPMTRKQIAEMTGVPLRSCVRQMRDLERREIIRSLRGRILVANLHNPWETSPEIRF